jgi:hypothetical protein
MTLLIFMAGMAITVYVLLIPKGLTRWKGNFRASLMRENGLNQLTISVPLPLGEIYRMIPLSAKQISLDSPFNFFSDIC